jgi:hypothetical protein
MLQSALNMAYHKHEEMAASEVSSAMSLHKLAASSSQAKAASQSASHEGANDNAQSLCVYLREH